MYKFCIISFCSGTRGAYLGHQLLTNYPDYFSVRKNYKKNDPVYYNEYDTWHTYVPHFEQPVFFSYPDVQLENLFDSDTVQHLDKIKYNIILTHLYTDAELSRLCTALAGHEIKTVQILFEPQDKTKIINRLLAVFPNMGIDTGGTFLNYMLDHLDNAYQHKFNNPTATIQFSELIDYRMPPNLENIVKHFIQDIK